MIVFHTEPNLLIENVYNNLVYRFSVDDGTTSVRAVVSIDDAYFFEIFPIKNEFYFNFKNIAKLLSNQNRFADTRSNDFIFKDDSLFISKNIKFRIIDTNGGENNATKPFMGIKAVENLLDTRVVENNEFRFLHNTNRLDYFKGYPFDVAFLTDNPDVRFNGFRILNKTNGLIYDVNALSLIGVYRLQLHELENLLPFALGYNEIEFRALSDNRLLNSMFIIKHDNVTSVYLKWFNSKGAWSYFQFPCVYFGTQTASNLPFLNTDTENVQDTISNFTALGKTASQRISIKTDALNQYQISNLLDLYTSPKVYIYVREQDSFKEVSIPNGSVQNINTKSVNRPLELTIELPNIYTQTYE